MKRLYNLLAALVLAGVVGCGGKPDLNQDLKPIDPNAPRPKRAGEGPKGKAPGEKPAAPILK